MLRVAFKLVLVNCVVVLPCVPAGELPDKPLQHAQYLAPAVALYVASCVTAYPLRLCCKTVLNVSWPLSQEFYIVCMQQNILKHCWLLTPRLIHCVQMPSGDQRAAPMKTGLMSCALPARMHCCKLWHHVERRGLNVQASVSSS